MSVPVLAVAGFLGAGKTTLLNHLLHNSLGARIGVLVNDFGAVNIDAILVAGQVDAMASLANGCICCVTEDGEVAEMLGKLAAVKPKLDLIVVEASGVAEPSSLARALITTDDKRFHYAGLALVIDAANPPADLEHAVRVADLLVLNKIDDASDPDGLRAAVAAIDPRIPLLPTNFARIDPELLIDPPTGRAPSAQMSLDELLHDEHDHEHPNYQSVEFGSDHPMNPRIFLDVLKNRPDGLYRAKGFVDFGPGHRYLLQLVGSSLRFERSRAGKGEGTELVCIGAGMDADAVRAAFARCTREPADENAMLGVLKFVV